MLNSFPFWDEPFAVKQKRSTRRALGARAACEEQDRGAARVALTAQGSFALGAGRGNGALLGSPAIGLPRSHIPTARGRNEIKSSQNRAKPQGNPYKRGRRIERAGLDPLLLRFWHSQTISFFEKLSFSKEPKPPSIPKVARPCLRTRREGRQPYLPGPNPTLLSPGVI